MDIRATCEKLPIMADQPSETMPEDVRQAFGEFSYDRRGFPRRLQMRDAAEFERHLILARTNEGRERAKARGVRFGRKLKLTKHQIQEALARREAGEPLTEIGKSYNVSHSTISRLGA